MYLKYPVNYINITNDYTTVHTAIDLGWNINQNDPVFACGNGIVEKIYTFEEGGNTIRIKYDNNMSSEFMHLRDNTITVKVGDRVTYNQKVAEIGTTGSQTTGPHVHVIIRNANNARIDPKSCLYVYNDQEVNDKSKDKVLYYYDTFYDLKPTTKDDNKNQIEIIIENLRVRRTPGLNGEIVGFIQTGIYDYENVFEADNFLWYEVGKNYWIAYKENYGNLYPKKEENSCEEEINNLKEIIDNKNSEITEYLKQIEQKDLEIKNLEDLINNKNNYKFTYISNKTDMYAIKIYEGETLSIK